MPGMDGLDAAQRIKADMNPREIPAVLMVTAYGQSCSPSIWNVQEIGKPI